MSTKNNDLSSVVDVLTQIHHELIILSLPEVSRPNQRQYFQLAPKFQSLTDSIQELEHISDQRLQQLVQNQVPDNELESDEQLNQLNGKLKTLDKQSNEVFDAIYKLVEHGGVLDTLKIVYN